ncbi:hypothetical protein bcgnr5369_25240 [Bacillus cereus]
MEKNIIWKDKSSYSRAQREQAPSVLTATIGKIDITVHRHIFYKGWVLSSRKLDIKTEPLDFENLEDCKKQALEKVTTLLEGKIKEYQDAQSTIKNVLD